MGPCVAAAAGCYGGEAVASSNNAVVLRYRIIMIYDGFAAGRSLWQLLRGERRA